VIITRVYARVGWPRMLAWGRGFVLLAAAWRGVGASRTRAGVSAWERVDFFSRAREVMA
jgi:hypothetical protein